MPVKRARTDVGGGNASRPEASAAEIVHLEEEGEIVDAVRLRDHQAMEILAMRAVRFLGARVGLDAEERRQGRERQVQAGRA